MTEAGAYRMAVRRLHAEKDAAYGPSWKRRGELISVLANIARKVDRLEQVALGAPVTRDENVLDTATDLVVYTLKYQTFLADLDAGVAASLFATMPPPYSDGRLAFETLLDALDLSSLDNDTDEYVASSTASSTAVVNAFGELERCFRDPASQCPADDRMKRTITLTAAAVRVVASLRHEIPELYRNFIDVWEE